MNIFLSKYTNQFYAHVPKHVHEIINEVLEGIAYSFELETLNEVLILYI